MIKGYCPVCCKWVGVGTLMPCVDRVGDTPPSTCGLLKPHNTQDFPETTFDDVRGFDPMVPVRAESDLMMPRSLDSFGAAVEAFLPSALAIEAGPDVVPTRWSESIPDDAADLFDEAECVPPGDGKVDPYPDGNPKTVLGLSKPSFTAIPPVALIHLGAAMADGRRKYGLMNWREHSVTTSVYIDAIYRHLMSYWDGQDDASDSLVNHLGHVMACCAIILDAEATGQLNDDRPIRGPFPEMVAALTKKVA